MLIGKTQDHQDKTWWLAALGLELAARAASHQVHPGGKACTHRKLNSAETLPPKYSDSKQTILEFEVTGEKAYDIPLESGKK